MSLGAKEMAELALKQSKDDTSAIHDGYNAGETPDDVNALGEQLQGYTIGSYDLGFKNVPANGVYRNPFNQASALNNETPAIERGFSAGKKKKRFEIDHRNTKASTSLMAVFDKAGLVEWVKRNIPRTSPKEMDLILREAEVDFHGAAKLDVFEKWVKAHPKEATGKLKQ